MSCDRKKKSWRIELSAAGDLRFRLPGETISCTIDGEPSTCRGDPRTDFGELKMAAGAKKIDISWNGENAKP